MRHFRRSVAEISQGFTVTGHSHKADVTRYGQYKKKKKNGTLGAGELDHQLEYLLNFQRTYGWFPAPIKQLTPVPEDPKPSSGNTNIHKHTHTLECVHTHMKRKRSFRFWMQKKQNLSLCVKKELQEKLCCKIPEVLTCILPS